MVVLACWCCKKNLGNKKCEQYPNGVDIKKGTVNCKYLEPITEEEIDKKYAEGIKMFWGLDEIDNSDF